MNLSKEELKKAVDELKPFDDHNGNFIIDCPSCGHRECSISYKKDNNQWGCFRKKHCGDTGNIFTLLKKLGKQLHVEKSIDVFEQKLSDIDLKSSLNNEKSLYLEEAKLPLGYKRISDSKYLNERGFTKQDYLLWEVGKSSLIMKDYVVFPIYQDDGVKAYVGRLDTESDNPKYKNSKTDFTKILGGLDKVDKETHSIFLCEGYFDIINVTRLLNLLDDSEIRALCTFGAKISLDQIERLKQTNIKNIYLLFDNDVPKIVKEVALKLSNYFNVKVLTIKGDKDAGDCNLEHLYDAIEYAKSPLEFNLNTLGAKIV